MAAIAENVESGASGGDRNNKVRGDDAESGSHCSSSEHSSFSRSAFYSNGERLSIAPMMAVTDRWYRYMMRMVTRRTWLWTEMVVDDTILHYEDTERLLGFEEVQHPICLQLGGSRPDVLAEAASICLPFGYDEMNLNCGCPSNRVANKRCFGARLMLDPEQVRKICHAVNRRVSHSIGSITCKCRLGADDKDSFDNLRTFVGTVAQAGVRRFYVHARKCLLDGLSTNQNRSIPPLRPHWIHALQREFPDLEFSLNGGVKTLDEVESHLACNAATCECAGRKLLSCSVPGKDYPKEEEEDDCDDATSAMSRLDLNGDSHGDLRLSGVMVGRAAYQTPWIFADADRRIFGDKNPGLSRREIVQEYTDYAVGVQEKYGYHVNTKRKKLIALEDGAVASKGGVPVADLCKPLLGLFKGAKGGRAFRRTINQLTNEAGKIEIGPIISRAVAEIDDDALDERF